MDNFGADECGVWTSKSIKATGVRVVRGDQQTDTADTIPILGTLDCNALAYLDASKWVLKNNGAEFVKPE